MSAKIHQLKSVESDKYQSLIKNITTHLTENLTILLTNMFNGADDTLFHLAEMAESNDEQSHFFETMRMLRLERDNIARNFTAEVNAFLNTKKLIETDVGTIDFDADELTLVDQDTMEEMVAISAMHSKAMNLFGQEISHLEARLEFLAVKTSQIFDKQAFQPKNFCTAFQASLSPVVLSIKNKLILYKLFDQQVISKMQACYHEINNILIAEEILPQIKISHSSSRPGQSPTITKSLLRNSETVEDFQPSESINDINDLSIQVDSPLIDTSTSNTASSTESSHQQIEINRAINKYFHGTTSQHQNPDSNFSQSKQTKSTQFYDRRDILKALSNLQHSYQPEVDANHKIDIDGFKRSLITQLGAKNGGAITRQVNQLDEKTIDFIEMLFEAIAEDLNVSEVITNLLLRLQIPVIKIAMLDQEIFHNNNHPARNLLNLIVSTGKSITDKSDPLFSQLETEVDTLINDFNIDIISFQNAIDNINTLINKDESSTADTERNTQKNILQNHARVIVLHEMQHHLKSKKLPTTVRPLILKHWSTLMFHRYIRNGRDSLAWKEACNVLILIINSLQPLKSSLSWMSLKNNHMGLIDTLNDYLLETKFNSDEIKAELINLKSAYDSLIDTSEYNPVNNHETTDTEVSICPDPDTELCEEITLESFACDAEFLEDAINNTGKFSEGCRTLSPIDQQSEINRKKISSLPREVRPGVWFEIYNGDEHSVRRLKLSVIIMEEAQLIFVDRHGKKVIEKDAAVFTEELVDNKSKVIADHSAFDNALSKVITSLTANA